MRHADLRREANSSDSQASFGAVALYCCVVPGRGVWACRCVFGGGTRDATSKKTCKTFSTELFDWQIRSANWKTQSKKLFSDCARKPDLGFSRKRPFLTDKSTV